MSRIKIQNKTLGERSAMSAWGTKVFVDEREVNHVRSVDLHVSIDDPVSAMISVLATEDMNVELDAHVTVTISLLDEWLVIEETPLENGGRVFTARRVVS